MLRRVVWYKFSDILDVLTACIIRAMMEELSTFETSVNLHQTTQRNIPEDSQLHTRRCENLKSLKIKVVSVCG
jgi:hypothetical protein